MPGRLGFHMPAEWEPHFATWLSWPHKEASWPGKFEPVPAIFAGIAKALLQTEEVNICVKDQALHDSARRELERAGAWIPGRLHLHIIPTNDSWMRDHGPIFVVRDTNGHRELHATDWIYNAWGGKYPPYDADDEVPQHIARKFGYTIHSPGIVLEGGSIDVNGRGTLLTSEACLLNKNRNPHLRRPEIEGYLKDHLGVTKILWLGDGIVGDDTDGHIDDLARFVDPHTVVTVVEEDPQDENYPILQDNLHRLRSLTDQDNQPLRVLELPMPLPISHDGQRLPASYANFYIANGQVLVPTYRDPADQRALAILAQCFPDRRIVGIDCVDLVWGLGAIHCITQQHPLGVPAP